MCDLQPVDNFFTAIADDARISTTHISLYMALLKLWNEGGGRNPIQVFSKIVMPICKISGIATYHKCIRELHDYGYIKYTPSFYRSSGSAVFLIGLKSDIYLDGYRVF